MSELLYGVFSLVGLSFVFLFVAVRVLVQRKKDEEVRGNVDLAERIGKSIKLVVLSGTLATLFACACLFIVFYFD